MAWRIAPNAEWLRAGDHKCNQCVCALTLVVKRLLASITFLYAPAIRSRNLYMLPLPIDLFQLYFSSSKSITDTPSRCFNLSNSLIALAKPPPDMLSGCTKLYNDMPESTGATNLHLGICADSTCQSRVPLPLRQPWLFQLLHRPSTSLSLVARERPLSRSHQ